jgi:uncharacterized protein (DUF58 family)
MHRIIHIIRGLYLRDRLFVMLGVCAVSHTAGYFLHWLGVLPSVLTGLVVLLTGLDILLLFRQTAGVDATRRVPERLSNGDDNTVRLYVKSRYPFPLGIELVDELPEQFQQRDFILKSRIRPLGDDTITYTLRPVKRGVYQFGALNVFVRTPVGLAERRYKFDVGRSVPVYPSFLQMRRFQLMAINDRLSAVGVKRIRSIGHSMEFEQVRDYVQGDDIRTINWKATARRGQMMVNAYIDERSQQVYCVIDKGRTMRMPFDGLSLLDHAVNASVVMSNVALVKQDKAGILTFSEEIGQFLAASSRASQMGAILDMLHHQRSRYLESDFERLHAFIRKRISQRSLILLFTNFESLSGMRRQLPYLRSIARNHLLMVVFFENPMLKERMEQTAGTMEDVYQKTIAARFDQEKRLIVRELQQYGIGSILTPPKDLTVRTVNTYLELKARQSI